MDKDERTRLLSAIERIADSLEQMNQPKNNKKKKMETKEDDSI
mgnify:CR=1 FL=1